MTRSSVLLLLFLLTACPAFAQDQDVQAMKKALAKGWITAAELKVAGLLGDASALKVLGLSEVPKESLSESVAEVGGPFAFRVGLLALTHDSQAPYWPSIRAAFAAWVADPWSETQRKATSAAVWKVIDALNEELDALGADGMPETEAETLKFSERMDALMNASDSLSSLSRLARIKKDGAPLQEVDAVRRTLSSVLRHGMNRVQEKLAARDPGPTPTKEVAREIMGALGAHNRGVKSAAAKEYLNKRREHAKKLGERSRVALFAALRGEVVRELLQRRSPPKAGPKAPPKPAASALEKVVRTMERLGLDAWTASGAPVEGKTLTGDRFTIAPPKGWTQRTAEGVLILSAPVEDGAVFQPRMLIASAPAPAWGKDPFAPLPAFKLMLPQVLWTPDPPRDERKDGTVRWDCISRSKRDGVRITSYRQLLIAGDRVFLVVGHALSKDAQEHELTFRMATGSLKRTAK